MQRVQRPCPGETDEDLLQQEEELLRSGKFVPAAKLVKVNKRKTEDAISSSESQDSSSTKKPQSRFADAQSRKKKKEGIKDRTVLQEAAANVEANAVLKRVVSRSVPTTADFLASFDPLPSPYGFPKPLQITVKNDGAGIKNKSLYMQQMEKNGLLKTNSSPALNRPNTSENTPVPMDCNAEIVDQQLQALGGKSYIVKGDTADINEMEIEKIHSENLQTISNLTHEERLREREEYAAQLSPEQLQFIMSLRKKREEQSKQSPKDNVCHDISSNSSLKSDRLQTSGITEGNASQPKTENEKKVQFSEDVDKKEIPKRSEEMTLPIDLEEAKKWVNMAKVDMDKLRWMTDMPAPKPLNDNEGHVARFNFEGDLLPYDADISYRAGLHHHGEESGRAGYSIDELFILIRSQVLQQRNMGLTTLGNILRNAKEGAYDDCFGKPLIHLMIEAGIGLLLRFSMDDSSALVYQPAIRALYYLVTSEPDERCLALTQPWMPAGLEPQVSSQIHSQDKARKEIDEEEKELKDFEIIQLDVVRALIRMDTHLRIRYILETVKPSPETVIHLLGILTRFVRHSLTAAWTLANTPRLIGVIVENFLPHNISALLTGENVANMTSVYGVPLRHALHLLRVWASQGRQLSAILCNTFDIMSRILSYVSLEPSEVEMPRSEAMHLSKESYAMWATLLRYGLIKPQEAVSSFYPMLVRQLIFYRDKVNVNEDTDTNRFNFDVGAHIFEMLMRALNVAATHSLLETRMFVGKESSVNTEGKGEVLQPPVLKWTDLNDIPGLLETCLNKWLSQLARDHQSTSYSALRMIGCCCNFLNSFFTKWKDQKTFSGQESIQKIQNIYEKSISIFLKSAACQEYLKLLPDHSALVRNYISGEERDPNNLGSLCCVTKGGKIVPLILPSSPLPLLLPLFSLVYNLHVLHPVLEKKSANEVLDSSAMIKYLTKISTSSYNLASNWITRIEVHFLWNILQLAALKECQSMALFHKVGVRIVSCIHRGDEWLVKDLLNNIVCAPEFAKHVSELTSSVGDLALKDCAPLESPATSQPTLSPLQLNNQLQSSLSSMAKELIPALVTDVAYDTSTVWSKGIPFLTNSLSIIQKESSLALDKYWPLIPLKQLYKENHQAPPGPEFERIEPIYGDISSPETILCITRCVQMTYLILKHCQNKVLEPQETTGWFKNLSLIFLASNDLFLDSNISSYVQGCLMELVRNKGYLKIDCSIEVPGHGNVMGWYRSMCAQFKSVSYGDSTFAFFIIIPLQQHWPPGYRTHLWGDACDTMTFIRLLSKHVETFIPIMQFLEPVEEVEDMIILYKAAIGTNIVTEKRTPFLHHLAMHHINHFKP
ncbi:unnamed protein product [Meganyctiphanes norvegica]|uniref:RNA polymerase II-associated protein 1 n=1 Tax=Meganyctiphanes norvegica TaxID=48144 RepID=A0AAV2QIY8_MEGNR